MNKYKSMMLTVGLIFSVSISANSQTPNTNLSSPSPSPAISASPSPQASTAPKVTLDGNELIVPAVNFSLGSDSIDSSSISSLQLVRDYLNQKTDITLIRIEGHVSSQNGTDLNQELSSRRAVAVARWLVSSGINCNRLIAVGFGESKPVSENTTLNDRISFYNAALRGRAIGGIPIDGGGVTVPNLCNEVLR